MAAVHPVAYTSGLPTQLDEAFSHIGALDADLRLRLDTNSDHTVPSETSTLSGRHDSLASSRSSIYSSNTSNCSQLSTSTKPTKRVRFEESVCWSYFDANEEIPLRPQLRKRPSFMSRSWDRIITRNSPPASDVGVPPAALSAMSDNLYQLKRRNSSVDLSELASKATSRYTTPGKASSLVLSVQQPLREGIGRRYNGAQTAARFMPKRHAPKGEWDDLLGPATRTP